MASLSSVAPKRHFVNTTVQELCGAFEKNESGNTNASAKVGKLQALNFEYWTLHSPFVKLVCALASITCVLVLFLVLFALFSRRKDAYHMTFKYCINLHASGIAYS